MKEREFLKLCRDTLGLKSLSEAKERKELFWKSIEEALKENDRVVFKDWGVFIKKDVNPRKVKIPTVQNEFYTQPKKVVKFLCGKGLRTRVNEDD